MGERQRVCVREEKFRARWMWTRPDPSAGSRLLREAEPRRMCACGVRGVCAVCAYVWPRLKEGSRCRHAPQALCHSGDAQDEKVAAQQQVDVLLAEELQGKNAAARG